MLGTVLKALWKLVTLPVALFFLPFKIASLLVGLVVYGALFVGLGLVVVFVL
ncbi:hypothetical protein SAMN05216226_11029 [Halovenus aranensis]|uniref:Uncharacterized protein n=1 Tax=Halovenus aranensis TaxID=890420 RepID=A0A1G8WZM8_9EURY|nr:hypothetical protein [Halovenus aranensis]SDJ83671.1 hypothetical protein SAMN05216226_11029 [Halovenus aranensis]